MHAKLILQSEIEKATESIESGMKKSVLLSGAWDASYAVAVVVADHMKAKAEVHEKAADVWHVLKGSGRFTLGGILVNPEQIQEGEWLADGISDATTYQVNEGDVIDVPPGVPHQIDAFDSRLELFIVKINIR